MFTENAMPKIWFTDLPRAIFLRLGSLELTGESRLRAQRKLLRQNIWKCQLGPDLPIEVLGGLLRYLEVGCSLYWPEAFDFLKTCQAITSEDAKIRPIGNFRGFAKWKYPVTMIMVAVQVIAVCPPRFMSWTACATFSWQGYLGAKARSPH